MKRALILANGKPPSKRLFDKFFALADWFVCADGGANTAARFDCPPHLIIGDFDSIEDETRALFSNVSIKLLKNQNSTDLEKALTAVIQKKYKEIVVLGATGGRLDHAIGNLSALVKFSGKAHITFIDDRGTFIAVKHSIEINLQVGSTISLLPLSRCNGIVTSGLKWDLKNESLELGVRESTSNVSISSPVNINVKKGSLIVFILSNNKNLLSQP
jgi:thiamine pyrophosphokinase